MTTMTFGESSVVAETRYTGTGRFNMDAGEKVIIRVSGETVLSETVPAGKTWEVGISVTAIESDV